MSIAPRLSLTALPASVARPSYTPAQHGVGIVHIGLGAFHRAHQAVYTDTALGVAGGDWRIAAASLRSTAVATELAAQQGLYTLIERDAGGDRARVIGSIAQALAGPDVVAMLLERMASPDTRIVSLTVTEKAYGLDRAHAGIDVDHADVAADLLAPRRPRGVCGLLVEGLRQRRERGLAPFTVLCCDNLPDNGRLLAGAVIDLARHSDPALADWITARASFPSTMVDRITPRVGEQTLADAQRLTGCVDPAAVEAEPFTQWVIEDRFPLGRPAWELAGAHMVDSVAPYERMKLRMLNGAHSLIAYAGFLGGCDFVRDAMAWPALAAWVRRLMAQAAATLEPLPGIDTADYARQLRERFENPAIRHATAQIAMDGTEKMPQRILEPAMVAIGRGLPMDAFAFATACWMRYALARHDDGRPYPRNDPRDAAIDARLRDRTDSAEDIYDALSGLPFGAPEGLWLQDRWREAVIVALRRLLARGTRDGLPVAPG
ncbi:MAG: mannitol dehydrogenase family protein [Burkholderiaceae bacterium]